MSFSLISGKEYKLSEIFSGNRKIIIPDLQRDYCWGDKAWNKEHSSYRELVTGFLDSLLNSFQDSPNDKLLLGLVYGFEHPKNQIQLCDGQQRVTTLFLILGIINRLTNFEFSRYLISEDELKDDKNPYLQYAIRESTLYFTSDLVSEVFLNQDIKLAEIKKCSWYYLEYDQDPSIQSMLKALAIIEQKLSSIENQFELGNFILNNLYLLYYDMGDRINGEETFVVINTTGEPLTASENLKPILIGNIVGEDFRNKASTEWEDREEWFWEHKLSTEATADEGHLQFFIWYWQIRLLQEKAWKGKTSFDLNPIELFQKKPKVFNDDEEQPELSNWDKSIDPNKFHIYYKALVKLLNACRIKKISDILRTIKDQEICFEWFRVIDRNIVLPLIAYFVKFQSDDEYFYQFVRRLRKNYFDGKWDDRKSNYVDWRHIIQIIELAEKPQDILKYELLRNREKFKKIAGVDLNEWYNQEEQLKEVLKIENRSLIEGWEDHPHFYGDLSFFLNFAPKEQINMSSLIIRFANYSAIIDTIRNQIPTKDSNIYRLLLVLTDTHKIERKYRMKWGIDSVLYSTLGRSHLSDEAFINICRTESKDITTQCISFIKDVINRQQLFNLTEQNFTTQKGLKCWLTLKTFEAFRNNVCLAYFDANNTGVSIHNSADDNKILKNEPFSLANFICGFGVKSGGGGSYVSYNTNHLWLQNNIIDSPFDGIAQDVKNRNADQLIKNGAKINEIIQYIDNIQYVEY
jgi:hypothetical protein